MALFKIPAMLRMSLRYVNTFKCLMVFYVLCLPCLQIEMYPYSEYSAYYCPVNVPKWICFGEKIFDKISKLFKSPHHGYICFDG